MSSHRYLSSLRRSLLHSSLIATVAIALLTIGCSGHHPPAEPDQPPGDDTPSLYERLGGEYAIAAVVDDFITRITHNEVLLANKVVAAHLPAARLPGLELHVATQICQATGGPCKYTGLSMLESHKHLGITPEEWDAFAGDFVASLNHFKVPEAEQQELLAIVSSLRGDIVTAE